VSMPIFEGGLEIRNLLRFNHALLSKWLSRNELEREAWWRVVVDSKYGISWRGWYSSEPIRAYGVGLWKNIKRGWEQFCNYTRFEVGDGSKVKFWHDLWCGDMALKDAFLVIINIVCAKDAPVEAHINISGDAIQ
jgi:hypothetical protein